MAKKSAKNLTREEWLRRSLEVLAAQGPGKLNIESLSRSLGVSRGSFYWHFENRDDSIMTKEKLLAVGDQYEKQLATDIAAMAKYR